MSVDIYSGMLRDFCMNADAGVAPYLLRTRIERALYGLLVSLAKRDTGGSPTGITRAHVDDFVSAHGASIQLTTQMIKIASIFEQFTYLSDTSNWSPDGQDPRIALCREDILSFCASIGDQRLCATAGEE